MILFNGTVQDIVQLDTLMMFQNKCSVNYRTAFEHDKIHTPVKQKALVGLQLE